MNNSQKLIERLLPLARDASARAYSPYSGVRVGAVTVGADDTLHLGCNVENASYGLTQCAERNALATAIAAGQTKGSISALLVYATGFESLTPCGACRQVMSELLAKDALVISCSDSQQPKVWTPETLLPDPFTLDRK
ncbi:MAG: cytidine deaminase [Xanthomonadales bacterium]|nr:cytidine deaminase [Xanthomonadales bacterium]NNL95938.1 cytidine deaminase [Xanthomonadales bacterium]